MKRKIFSVLLAIIMLFSGLYLTNNNTVAKAISFSQLNDSSTFLKQAGSTTCTLCAATMMIRRYSMLRGDANWSSITESAVRTPGWINGTGLRWSFSYSSSTVSSISIGHGTLPGGDSNASTLIEMLKKCPEGIVIYNTSVPHAVLLTDYTDGVFYCADPLGNSPSGRIPLTSAYKVRINNVTAYWKVTSPVVDGPDDTDTHTHSYSKNYEAAHPHKVYMKCSCGDYYYTLETTFLVSCSSCNNTSTVSTYPTPFKGYTLSTGKTQVSSVNGSMTAKSNKIYSTDECTVDKVYANGWCHVTFPLDAGGTDNGYVPLSTFLNTSYSVSQTTIGSQTTTYCRSDGATNYGYIGSGDTVTKVGSSGSYTQILYPLSSGGYKIAWAILPTQTDPVGSSVGCAENWTSNAKSGLRCRVSPGTSAAEVISGYGMAYGKEIIIAKKQYDSAGNLWGWGHGYNDSLGRNLEGWYCLTYANYNYSYVPSVVSISISPAAYPDKTVITWTAADKATHYDIYVDGSCVARNYTSRKYEVALQSGSHSVKIAAVNSDFPYISSYDCYSITNAVSFTTTTKQYTISYDANGGSGAPSKQTKTYNVNLTLSSIVPSRQEYNFLGWSTDSSATSSTYSAGATYSKNNSITLYAVWSCAHPYDSGKIITVATCTSTGIKTYTCTNCGKTKTETIAKNSSNHAGGTTIKNAKSATCSSEGYTGDKYCSGCGVKLSTGQTIAKTAHSYNSGTITTAATCTTAGVKTYTCTVCKTTKTETIAALGHNFNGASRTNSDGSVSYKCTRCNEYGNTVSLTKIAIESMPSKTVYNIGESLNTSGLKLKLTYSDASTKSVTSGFTTSGFNSSTAGTKTITVSYGGKTTSFNITVNSAAVDESSAQITVDSAKTTAGQTVQLCVKLKNNPGIAGLVFSLDYDKNALTLTNTSNGSLFDSFTPGKNFMWDSANNVTADGTLATFTFNVSENAEKGDYSISVTVRSCVNEAGEDITLNVVGGKISVIDFKYGDANGDGIINMKDVVLLRQYIANYDYDTNTSSVTVTPGADANGDSKIDMKDVVILRQYIANYDYDTDTSTVVLGPQ